MVQKGKGTGMGGCCCGGCRAVPSDAREGAGGLQNVIEIQQYCCRCIPKQVCISVTYDAVTSLSLVPKGCNAAPYDGDPIQYQTTFDMDGDSYTLNFRLTVIDGDCYWTWDIPELELSDQTLIDQDDLAGEEACNHGMKARQCALLNESWTVVTPSLEITLAEVESRDLQDLVECAGCKCICDCMCISIYSRNAETGIYTLVGSNEVECATLSRESVSGGGNPDFYVSPWIASWASHGWSFALGDQYERQINDFTVDSGTGSVPPLWTVRDAVWIGDEVEHTITGETAQVTYEWEIEFRIAKYLKWVGRSYDEGSVVDLAAWNWTTAAWDIVASVNGRPVSTNFNRIVYKELAADYTGTGLDEGKVRIQLVTTSGAELHTDLIRIGTAECCALTLTPPGDVTLESEPARIPLTGTNACPSPNPFWQVTEDDGTEWFISASCSWCGGTCGTVATACCPRPIGNILFAEITLGCPTCAPATFVVPLISDGTGAIWTGSAVICGLTFEVNFSCSGTAWHISVDNGPCTFSGDASSVDCETFTVGFGGMLGGGLGCCGPTGDPMASPSIGVVVFE